MNIILIKKDGKEDEQAVEKKYRWDEENRLLASDENGFVANYWYDADGERTVKSSGEGEQIYVNCRANREQSQARLGFAKAQPTIIYDNSEFSGGVTNTAKFSLYVSPYLVASQGGKYTKHIYIGSQRIVSKLGDLASYGADPRRIPYAGTEADGVSVDYVKKYSQQQLAIRENYSTFGVNYNGMDNNDYVSGQGFCCNDNSPEAARAKMLKARAVSNNFHDTEEYERMQFYYHPDHLGSSSYITNLDGEVVQHIEYVPFGEVFIEERNNTWNTPYLFNAKEYDEETGMYYYGARYYEPRISLWMSTDPMQAKYPHISTYCYASNNPIKYIDIDGCDWFVNDQNFYVWSMNTQVSGFSYAGNILPSNVSRYQILENINGKYYHKYTSNIFASIGNFLLGKNSFIEKKAYSHAEESFNSELISQGATIIAFSVVGKLGKAALSAFKAGGESVGFALVRTRINNRKAIREKSEREFPCDR